MRRKILLLLIPMLLVGMLFPALRVSAAENGKLVISDGADLLTEDEEQSLRSVMEPILEYGCAGFCSVSSNPGSAPAYAESFYLRTFGKTDGVLFLIDMDNRKIYIYSGNRVYQTVTKTRAETITDNVYRYASKNQYYECAAEAFREIHTLLEGGRIAQPMKYASNALLALILAFLINFIIVRSVTKLKAPREKEILEGAKAYFNTAPGTAEFTHKTKRYDPIQTSSGGGGGGGFSGGGGGGGGGGFSGGGGGHSF